MIDLNDIKMRNEQPNDYFETENLVREAFWNQYTPGGDEHYILHLMRHWSSFVAELDIVAIYENHIVGSIVYNQSYIIGDNGLLYNTLALGPIAVLPKFQNQGIGGYLIDYTRNLAHKMNFCAIVLFGDPDYYLQHGFQSAENFGLRTYDNFYKATLHVCELQEGSVVAGRYFENSRYVPNDENLKAYDSQFSPKIVEFNTPSQLRYKELLTMCRSFERDWRTI